MFTLRNKGANQIYEFYSGFCMGIIFLSKPIIATKKYFLVCPVCNNPNKELTLKEVQNSIGEGIIKGSTKTNNSSGNNVCPNCGNFIKNNYLFCKSCGAKL